jgi:hypothetical protein
MFAPLSRTSPSSAMRISTPGSARPTVPKRCWAIVCEVATVAVSVMP